MALPTKLTVENIISAKIKTKLILQRLQTKFHVYVRDVAWKAKAAVNRHSIGSMPFKRSNTSELITNSLKRLHLSIISSKNFKRNLLYYWHEKRKCISFSSSFERQKEQILKFMGVFGIVCLPPSIRNLWFPERNLLIAILWCRFFITSRELDFFVIFSKRSVKV